MGNNSELFGRSGGPPAVAPAPRAQHVYEIEPREERHARHYDGKAVRWTVDKVTNGPGRSELTLVSRKQPNSEIALPAGRYVVWAFGADNKMIDVERFTVDERGCVLHCGKNLPPAEAAGDPRRERDLIEPASGGT